MRTNLLMWVVVWCASNLTLFKNGQYRSTCNCLWHAADIVDGFVGIAWRYSMYCT